jgi:hypothetical protein
MNMMMQHYLNPLHIYCRLRDMGIPKWVAVSLCSVYERTIFGYVLAEERYVLAEEPGMKDGEAWTLITW